MAGQRRGDAYELSYALEPPTSDAHLFLVVAEADGALSPDLPLSSGWQLRELRLDVPATEAAMQRVEAEAGQVRGEGIPAAYSPAAAYHQRPHQLHAAYADPASLPPPGWYDAGRRVPGCGLPRLALPEPAHPQPAAAAPGGSTRPAQPLSPLSPQYLQGMGYPPPYPVTPSYAPLMSSNQSPEFRLHRPPVGADPGRAPPCTAALTLTPQPPPLS